MKKILLISLIFLLILPVALAKEGYMHLLAVKESSNEGSAADLFLEIKPGKGRVFLETIPLSKFDTQISTRFARDIACSYLDKDCSGYDFFYTIKAKSPIIGGPSAGAAIAVLTVAVLEGVDIEENVAITGTINSGSIIGPVGGLKAKIEAASELNIKTVLIPKGERFLKELNLTVDLADYAKKFNIAVVEVNDLTDALYYFTGKRFKKQVPELEINPAYTEIMKSLANELCTRTNELQKNVSGFVIVNKSLIDEEFVDIEKSAVNLTKKGKDALKEKQYYSAASYCFGANVKYAKLMVELDGSHDFESVENNINKLDKKLSEKSIKTITDLQAYMVVNGRLKDAADSVKKAKKSYEEDEDYATELGYAIERVYSAESWSKFFDMEGEVFNFNKESLKQSCLNKISEAEERYQYAQLYLPKTMEDTKAELGYASEDYNNGDFELCLFKASKVKAEADVILGVIGVAEEQMDVVLENKLDAVKRVIAEQQEKGIFPMLGYSYYEYAVNLKKEDQLSALLYAEYSLELSNLDIYFSKRQFNFIGAVDIEKLTIFAAGIALGIVAVLLVRGRLKGKKKSSAKKRRK